MAIEVRIVWHLGIRSCKHSVRSKMAQASETSKQMEKGCVGTLSGPNVETKFTPF